jgi:hypothetical protein
MAENTISVEKKSKREGALGAAIILLLLAGVGYLLFERVFARFNLTAKFDFDAIPTAIEIPPEDLHRVRQPGYALPSRRTNPQSPQLAIQNPEPSPLKPSGDSNTSISKIAANENSLIPVTPGQDESTKPNIARTSFTDEQTTIKPLIPPAAFSDFEGIKPPVPSNNIYNLSPSASSPSNDKESSINDFVPPTPSISNQPDNSFSSTESKNGFEPLTRTAKDLLAIPPESVPLSQPASNGFSLPFPNHAEKLPPTLNALNHQVEHQLASFETDTTPTPQPELFEKVADLVEPHQLVRVQSGDTLWDLCIDIYGDGRFFRAIFAVNQAALKGSSRLKQGIELKFPPLQHLISTHRELIPTDLLETQQPIHDNTERNPSITKSSDRSGEGNPRFVAANPVASGVNRHEAELNSYTTRPQDSLFSIAREQLGQASRYLEILELNRDQFPSKIEHFHPLPVGTPLKLPAPYR